MINDWGGADICYQQIITFTLSLQSDQNIPYTQSISRSTSYTRIIPSFCWRQSLIAELFFAGHRKQCEKYVCESGTLESFFVTSGLYFNWEIVSINNMYLILKCKFTKTIGSLNCRCAKSYQYYWQFILQMHQHQSLESGLWMKILEINHELSLTGSESGNQQRQTDRVIQKFANIPCYLFIRLQIVCSPQRGLWIAFRVPGLVSKGRTKDVWSPDPHAKSLQLQNNELNLCKIAQDLLNKSWDKEHWSRQRSLSLPWYIFIVLQDLPKVRSLQRPVVDVYMVLETAAFGWGTI